jgi:hypothetical protein
MVKIQICNYSVSATRLKSCSVENAMRIRWNLGCYKVVLKNVHTPSLMCVCRRIVACA